MPKAKNRKKPDPGEREAKGAISKPSVPTLGRVVFCFKYLDAKHKTFSLERLPKKFAKTLLERFRDFGDMDFSVFAPPAGNASLHSHKASNERVEAHGGFPGVSAELWEERPWQFAIQGKVRAVGFLISSIFHVVWIDADHKFDPGKGRT